MEPVAAALSSNKLHIESIYFFEDQDLGLGGSLGALVTTGGPRNGKQDALPLIIVQPAAILSQLPSSEYSGAPGSWQEANKCYSNMGNPEHLCSGEVRSTRETRVDATKLVPCYSDRGNS